MDYRFMGRTGLKVSEICLGCQTFGWGADEPAAHALADHFVDAGGNFLDTSNIYNKGVSETKLGTWLKNRTDRSQLVIATKVFFPAGKGPNDTGLSRKHIFDQIDASLRRLQTDYLDLYQMHCWDASTPLEETLRALDDLVRHGQGALYRRVELYRLAAHPGNHAQRDASLGSFRLPATRVQPAGAQHRMGTTTPLSSRGNWRHTVVAARRRLAERQIPTRTTASTR